MLMIDKGNDLHAMRDDDINRIVMDYRAGRISDEDFREKVTAWKTEWHARISAIIPGHTLEVLTDAKSRMPVFRITPKQPAPDDDLTADDILPTALRSQPPRPKRFSGPSR